MGAFNDLTNCRFDRLTVIGRASNKGNKTRWFCKCDCGQICIAMSSDLKCGKHRSCGCLQKESVTKHGYSPFDWKNRKTEYWSWLSMKQRCLNPNAPHYDRYGGRGITVCERWLIFANFIEDMGPKPTQKHTIERIDKDGNYEKSNCRWATRYEQAQNRNRASDSRIVIYQGEQMTMAEASRRSQLPYGLIKSRIYRGWPDSELFDPPETNNCYHLNHERDPKTGRYL